LSELLDISNGCKPYQAGYGRNSANQKLTSQEVKDRIYHVKEKVSSEYFPELKGKHIQPYYTKETKDFIKWGAWLMSPKDSKYFFQDKILVRQIIGEKFICTIDRSNSIADQSLYMAIPYDNVIISLEAFLGVLNSTLYGFFFRKFYSEEDDLFPKIKVNELKRLPYKMPDKTIEIRIESRVQQILQLKKENPDADTTSLVAEIDQLVYELYGLTEEEIGIVQDNINLKI